MVDINLKNIIAVSNASNKGKSSTLRHVANILLTEFPSEKIEGELPEEGDFRLIIRINELKIAVESQGDPGTRLKDRLIDLDKRNCDLIICTCRTKGETKDAILHLENTYNIIWTSTYTSNRDIDLLNRVKAEHIIDLLKKKNLV